MKKLVDVSNTRDAMEESIFDELKWLFKGYDYSFADKFIHINELPKKTEDENLYLIIQEKKYRMLF